MADMELGEGSQPIFDRDEIIMASKRTIHLPVEEHHRVVAIQGPSVSRLSGERYESPPPPRYSEMRSRDSYYGSDREHAGPSREYHPPRDYDRPHGPPGSYDSREKGHYDRFERHGDDVRHELKVRRPDDGRYPGRGESVRTYERGRDYGGESDSDLRMRINEKRADRHDREPGFHRMMERPEFERDRDRRRMMQPSPPGSERRRGPIEGYERSSRMPGRSSPVMHSSGGHDVPPERFRQGHPPERFHTSKPWNVNPEYVPKGRAYFEHDNRDDMVRMHGRGRGMPHMRGMFRGMMRGRGMMRRPMRGMSRGFMGGRATRRGVYAPF